MSRWTSNMSEVRHLVEKSHQLSELKMAGRGFANDVTFVFKTGSQLSGRIVAERMGNDAGTVGYPPQHYYGMVTIQTANGTSDIDLLDVDRIE